MRYLAPALLFLALALAAPAAEAQPILRNDLGQGAQPTQPLDRILNNIRRQFPGQVSDVQGPVGGRYRVKWLTPDGRILWVETDARTGQILGVQGETPFRNRNVNQPGMTLQPQTFRPDGPLIRRGGVIERQSAPRPRAEPGRDGIVRGPRGRLPQGR